MTSNSAPSHSYTFASDNWSGIHPEILEAITAANIGTSRSYGNDPWTLHFQGVINRLLGPEAMAYPVFNGTGANVLALQAASPRWGSVLCASTAHIFTSETGAPEKTGGLKLVGIPVDDGKLTPELVEREAWGWDNEHRAAPSIVSIAQVTELGTCYTLEEIRALAEQAHSHNMLLHIDGSRLGNAAAHLGSNLAGLTRDVGVDLVSLGGTKNGALVAEAVVELRQGVAPGLSHLRKINLQLPSKMRFISAQLSALYEGDLWLRSAGHANAMAAKLASGLQAIGAQILFPVESNAVFVKLEESSATRAGLDDSKMGNDTYRLMCSFETSEQDVDALLDALCAE